MTIYLDDITEKELMFPFGSVNSLANIRMGMLTIKEKWEHFFNDNVLLRSEHPTSKDHYTKFSVLRVPSNKALHNIARGRPVSEEDFVHLNNASDIFKYNDWALRQDFELLTKDKQSAPLPEWVNARTPENIFCEEGADIYPCFINAEAGPVYISRNVLIMEGTMIRGPLFLGPNSVVKTGTKIYGSTTVGPFCMVGGEIKNSVIMSYSNKAHGGYLGDSVIGEWCNLGAGTSNSNLKNNASQVHIIYDPAKEPVNAGMKCGLLMGDYSRSAVNTFFNTGTVVGTCCNIFGGMPPKFVPSFSWGEEKYNLEKALEDINNWKKFKGFEISEKEKKELTLLHQQSI